MFVFIVGVSLVFSLGRALEHGGRAEAVGRILRRSVVLYLVGVFYYGGFSTPFEGIRLLGVLQRIAISYMVAALLFCFLRPRALVAVTVGILVGYWALMTFVPVPGFGAGDFTEGRNLANYVDAHFLPLRKWDGDHDPEGLLSTLPAIANCLLGVFAGMLLQRTDRSDQRKVALLALAGVVSVTLGWLWHLQFPVIKKLWTSSFVLVACGYSALLLAAFYQVVEIWRLRTWAQPFVWIGVNPITIYLLFEFVDLKPLAARFLGGDLIRYFGRYGELCQAVILLALVFVFVRFLYRRKIFLRL
jgi:predicted acyltransferase